jgi:hypothetical protein
VSKQDRATGSSTLNACADRQLKLPLDARVVSLVSGPSAQVIAFKARPVSETSQSDALRKILDFADSLAP